MMLLSCWLVVTITLALLSVLKTVTAFSAPRPLCSVNRCITGSGGARCTRLCSSFNNDNDDDSWDLDDVNDDQPIQEDPRLAAMRSMLEASWDGDSMGTVPSNPQNAAEAAADSVADAMTQNKNLLMIDLRLPSYDITEGPRMYDGVAVYDFCAHLSDNLRERNLIRKSLVLVRNENERAEIDRVISRREDATTTVAPAIIDHENEDDDDDEIGDSELWEASDEGSEVDEFRKKLMSSWDTPTEESNIPGEKKSAKVPAAKPTVSDNYSHRLSSVLGNEEISTGPDMFDQVIQATDTNAILQGEEDALIIIAPYDTADVVAIRRTLARYGQTRTIIIVNSRMENLPLEMEPAVLTYGILPLIARSKTNGNTGDESGLKVVAMKRFPSDWGLYVDVYGDGFVEVKGPPPGGSDKDFPSPEWLAQRVQSHVEGLPKQ